MSTDKPMLADGSIVADYKPLFKYWELAKKRSRELANKAVLSRGDLELLQEIIRGAAGTRLSLADLLDLLVEKIMPRIDPDIAYEAIREVYGIELEKRDAQQRVARIVAGWIVEAGKTWGIIRIKGTLPSD